MPTASPTRGPKTQPEKIMGRFSKVTRRKGPTVKLLQIKAIMVVSAQSIAAAHRVLTLPNNLMLFFKIKIPPLLPTCAAKKVKTEYPSRIEAGCRDLTAGNTLRPSVNSPFLTALHASSLTLHRMIIQQYGSIVNKKIRPEGTYRFLYGNIAFDEGKNIAKQDAEASCFNLYMEFCY